MAKLRLRSKESAPSDAVMTKSAKQAPKEIIVERIVEIEKYIEKPIEKIYTQVSYTPSAMWWIIGIESTLIAILIHLLAHK